MRVFYLLIIPYMLLDAQEYTLELYKKLFPPLFDNVSIIIFADKKSEKILQKSAIFEVQDRCNASVNLLVGSHFVSLPQSCKSKPLFATTYRAYSENNNAFGAFYWKKGRPQIHFKRAILKKFHLKLPKKLKRFLDE